MEIAPRQLIYNAQQANTLSEAVKEARKQFDIRSNIYNFLDSGCTYWSLPVHTVVSGSFGETTQNIEDAKNDCDRHVIRLFIENFPNTKKKTAIENYLINKFTLKTVDDTTSYKYNKLSQFLTKLQNNQFLSEDAKQAKKTAKIEQEKKTKKQQRIDEIKASLKQAEKSLEVDPQLQSWVNHLKNKSLSPTGKKKCAPLLSILEGVINGAIYSPEELANLDGLLNYIPDNLLNWKKVADVADNQVTKNQEHRQLQQNFQTLQQELEILDPSKAPKKLDEPVKPSSGECPNNPDSKKPQDSGRSTPLNKPPGNTPQNPNVPPPNEPPGNTPQNPNVPPPNEPPGNTPQNPNVPPPNEPPGNPPQNPNFPSRPIPSTPPPSPADPEQEPVDPIREPSSLLDRVKRTGRSILDRIASIWIRILRFFGIRS